MTNLEIIFTYNIVLAHCTQFYANAYYQSLLVTPNESKKFVDLECANTILDSYTTMRSNDDDEEDGERDGMLRGRMVPYFSSTSSTTPEPDPYRAYEGILHRFLFGHKLEHNHGPAYENENELLKKKEKENSTNAIPTDQMIQYPTGSYLRSETFNNKTAVHFCPMAYIHVGHSRLNVTMDHMQTALNAFSILLAGDLNDVRALPSDYVLRSARTIAMMKLPMEKLVTLWEVVKNHRKTSEIPYYVLEMYRPLFKYLNAREIARLNLEDEQILAYVGRHDGLDRHQVGVVASKYIKMNKKWKEPKYLNLMSNLLCGVPLNLMRRLPSKVYLQLSHQLFYHVRACQPLQRRFYLVMMTRTDALGKSYSWSAQDVSRLGLLLTELQGYNLSLVKPEAMSGITAQVMLEMSARNLQYLSEMQIQNLGLKPLNILSRKLKAYQAQILMNNNSYSVNLHDGILLFLVLIILLNLVNTSRY